MADFSDDYSIVGASSDNFNCDSTGGWGTGGNATSLATNSDRVEGSYSLELTASNSGDSYWYHDISSGYRFKITEKDLHFWFKYVKGKGANFLVQNSTAVVVRLYFGGTTKYADYRCTSEGDIELKFGWQLLSCSGTNLRGGSVGGGHNGGSDYDLDIYRIELHLNFANKNDTPLAMDCWFVGTKIVVTNGTTSSPCTPEDIVSYSDTDRSAFPLGLAKLNGKLFDLKSGLDIGNGSDGAGNEGVFKITSSFFLLNQLSEEVKHHITVKNYSQFQSGEIETGSDDSYYVRGCKIVLPASRYSDFVVQNGGTCKLYATKLYRFRNIYLGALSDTGSTCEIHSVDFDSNECVYFRANTLNMSDVHIHDNPANIVNNACTFSVTPDSVSTVKIYRCPHGAYFDANVSVSDLTITDTTNYDIGIKDTYTVHILNSVFNANKLLRFT